MPIFKLDTPTEAKLTAFTPRTEHHGEDLVSAMSLALTITGPNTILDLLSPTLREALYMRADDESQEALDGIEPPTPKLRTKHLAAVIPLTVVEISGGTLYVEWGIGDDMIFTGCKVGKWRVEPMEGGSCALHFRVSTSDVDEQEAGHLFGKQGQVIVIRFEPPENVPAAESNGQVIDGTKGHPGAGPLFDGDHEGPTDAFVASHGVDADDDADDDTGDDDGGNNEDPDDGAEDTLEQRQARGEPAWPFPKGDPRAIAASGAGARSETPAVAPAPAPKTSRRARAPAAGTAPAAAAAGVKYRDPDTGQTWSGRGLKPRWLAVALEGGRTLAEFAVEAAAA